MLRAASAPSNPYLGYATGDDESEFFTRLEDGSM